MYKLILFDYNGTLVNTPFVDGQPLHILSGRPEKLATLREAGTLVGVCTNQAGPLWYVATSNPRYPHGNQVAIELSNMRRLLGCERDMWYVSLYDSRAMAILKGQYEQQKLIAPELVPEKLHHEMSRAFNTNRVIVGMTKDWRKPEPGMLTYACSFLHVETKDALYVGDMDDDQRAAEAAGMPFSWAHDFFGAEGER